MEFASIYFSDLSGMTSYLFFSTLRSSLLWYLGAWIIEVVWILYTRTFRHSREWSSLWAGLKEPLLSCFRKTTYSPPGKLGINSRTIPAELLDCTQLPYISASHEALFSEDDHFNCCGIFVLSPRSWCCGSRKNLSTLDLGVVYTSTCLENLRG